MYKLIDINDTNCERYLKEVMEWIADDFELKVYQAYRKESDYAPTEEDSDSSDSDHKNNASPLSSPKTLNEHRKFYENDPDIDIFYPIYEKKTAHVWYDREKVSECFKEFKAIVAIATIDGKEQLVGFLTYRYDRNAAPIQANIENVEVDENHQRKGLCKTMITHLEAKLPAVALLTCRAIPTSEPVFKKLGFTQYQDGGIYNLGIISENTYYKTVTNHCQPMKTSLPGKGVVLAISPEAPYWEDSPFWAKDNEEEVGPSRQYFLLTIKNKDGQLEKPITMDNIASYHSCELYIDGNRIDEGDCKSVLALQESEKSATSFLIRSRTLSPQYEEKFTLFLSHISNDKLLKALFAPSSKNQDQPTQARTTVSDKKCTLLAAPEKRGAGKDFEQAPPKRVKIPSSK